VERCLLSIMNDGVVILAQGMASCASDIDVYCGYGYG
jgi:hypothetical protein